VCALAWATSIIGCSSNMEKPEPEGHSTQRIGTKGRASACINGPSVYGGDYDQAAVDAVIALGAECVRINARADVWSTVGDASALAKYDALVDTYRASGVDVYMLVGHEAAGIAPDEARTWWGLDAYASAFVSLADHFRGRVRYFEAFNEPNNWVAPSYPALDARSFARLLARVWSDVRVAHPDWDVRIVAGAPFTFHQIGGSATNGADYLAETYSEGAAHEGWGWSAPVDGFGYHFYFDVESSWATANRVRDWIDAYWSVIAAHEGSWTDKKIFVSEFGWQSDETAWGEAEQAREHDAAFGALFGDERVAMAMWFNLQDFMEGDHAVLWGLYRQGGYDDAHAKPVRDRFRALTSTPGSGSSSSPSPSTSTSTSEIDVRYPIGEGDWITQCTGDGAELVFQTRADGRDEASRWASFLYPQVASGSCGAPSGGRHPLVLRSANAGELGGTWITQCAGSGNTQHVFRVDDVVDGHPAAGYLYDEIAADCP
jgi:hypothetical protein